MLNARWRIALGCIAALLFAGCSDGGSLQGAAAPGAQAAFGAPAAPVAATSRQTLALKPQTTPSSYTTLFRFYNSTSGGGNPFAGLLYANGVFYGTTPGFGVPFPAENPPSEPNPECGAVFTVTPNADFTAFTTKVIHRFARIHGCDALGSLIAVGSNLYGTTFGGGAHGGGTVFSISPADGTVTDLYSFSCGSDGCEPVGPLVNIGSNLYGVTFAGGSSCNCGTVYSVPLAGGSDTILYAFSGVPDGSQPTGGLVNVGTALYGTTSTGGSSNIGTVFGVPLTGGAESLLYSFTGGTTDGANPHGYNALLNVNSTLYGATTGGGTTGSGTVFSLPVTGGPDTLIYSFAGGADGSAPEPAPILIGSTLYGTTSRDGKSGVGTIYGIPLGGGADTVLHEFRLGNGGVNGENSALLAVNNALYGTTQNSGRARIYGYGTVFQQLLPP